MMGAEYCLCVGFVGNALCEDMAKVGLRRFWDVACFGGAGSLWGVEVMELLVAYGAFRVGRRLVCIEKMRSGVYGGVDSCGV